MPPEALREALARRALGPVPESVRAMAAEIASFGGSSVQGIIFFGSHRSGLPTDAFSARDFFVAVDAYAPFYHALRAAGAVRRSPGVFAALNAWLPPNQLALRTPGGLAKCSVVRLDHLERETGPRRRDHFCAGRLFQPATIIHAADEASRERMLDLLVSAMRETAAWGRLAFPAPLDAQTWGRAALALSMRWEIRPEPEGRAQALWQAQREEQVPVLEALLAECEAGALLRRDGGSHVFVAPLARTERWRLGLYFRRSLVRATLRWAKYMWTFEGWLDYIARKATRHTGQTVELTPRERRFPLLLLPRVWRFFRDRDAAPGRRPQ